MPFNSSQNSERYFHQIIEPERAPGFITNVLISNNVTDNEDDGYEILSSRDEAAERGSLFSSNNIRDRKMGCLSPGKNLQSGGGSTNSSHLHKINRKIEGRSDLETLKRDIGALKLRKELKAIQPTNGSPDSSLWSDNTDNDDEDLDEVADGSEHHKMYTRKDKQQRATSSAPRAKRRGMPFLSNPQWQNSDKSTCMSSEARGVNNASQETLSTTATLAEEFVWVDSHSRLVELQQLPWTHSDLMKVLRRTMEQDPLLMPESVSDMIAIDILPRLSYYLQRTLVRLAREAQRLSKSIGVCGKENVLTALKVVLSPSLAISAVKVCLRSAAMFAMSGDTTGQSKSSRSALVLSVGRMHEWMCLVKIGTYVTEYAAIYLTSTIEAVLEEIVELCREKVGVGANKSPLDAKVPTGASSTNLKNKLNHSDSPLLNADLLEKVVASSGEVWAIFQPYAHLNSSRTSNGSLSLSKCVEVRIPTFYDSLEASFGCNVHHSTRNIEKHKKTNVTNERNIKQILLTTCIGSTEELEDMVLAASTLFQQVWSDIPLRSNHFKGKLSQYYGACASSMDDNPSIMWSAEAIQSLFHFMRCSQLEYGHGVEGLPPIQELVYERPYMVLPPIMEWVRVSSCFAEHRNSFIVDDNDVLQAARVLLPGMDCPPRSLCHSAISWPSKSRDEQQCLADPKKSMAFHMMMSGCRDLIDIAKKIIGSSEADEITNGSGSTEMTALQVAALRGDLHLMKSLLDLASVNIDGTTTRSGKQGMENGDQTTKNWTPLTYASIAGLCSQRRQLDKYVL